MINKENNKLIKIYVDTIIYEHNTTSSYCSSLYFNIKNFFILFSICFPFYIYFAINTQNAVILIVAEVLLILFSIIFNIISGPDFSFKKNLINNIHSAEKLWEKRKKVRVIIYFKKTDKKYTVYDKNSINENSYDFSLQVNHDEFLNVIMNLKYNTYIFDDKNIYKQVEKNCNEENEIDLLESELK